MKKYILFDFDGVIADTFSLAFEAQKIICPHVDEELYRKRFEGNINDWDQPHNIHTEKCRHDIDFFSEYIPRMKKEAKIIPGMEKIIIDLKKLYTLIIISSTITSPIEEFLKNHNLAHHFTQIMGNDIHQSKVEKIKMVFDQHHTNAQDCIFITDTLGDMREAEKMDVKVIGVTWGFHSPQTLIKGRPFILVEKPDDLINAVKKYFESK